jgi:hypothetical protein
MCQSYSWYCTTDPELLQSASLYDTRVAGLGLTFFLRASFRNSAFATVRNSSDIAIVLLYKTLRLRRLTGITSQSTPQPATNSPAGDTFKAEYHPNSGRCGNVQLLRIEHPWTVPTCAITLILCPWRSIKQTYASTFKCVSPFTPQSTYLQIGVGQRAVKVLCFGEHFWFKSGRVRKCSLWAKSAPF